MKKYRLQNMNIIVDEQIPLLEAVSKARKSNQYAVIASPHTPFGTGSAKQSLTQNVLIVRDCHVAALLAMTALIVAGIFLRQLLFGRGTKTKRTADYPRRFYLPCSEMLTHSPSPAWDDTLLTVCFSLRIAGQTLSTKSRMGRHFFFSVDFSLRKAGTACKDRANEVEPRPNAGNHINHSSDKSMRQPITHNS